jgi:hypothetical protein
MVAVPFFKDSCLAIESAAPRRHALATDMRDNL